MALSREPTTNPESQRQHSPALFLIVLLAIVVGIAAFLLLRSNSTGTAAKPITNGAGATPATLSK